MKVTRPRQNIDVQVRVRVYRNFTAEIFEDENFVTAPCALHVSIDPISGRRSARLYTDDGHGNGEGILSIELE